LVHQLEGIASYYADEFHGRKTSNGEVYDMHALTAAHKTLPFNTTVKVVNLENRRSVVVRVNDRGPFKDDRVIDVSLEAAKQLGLIANGTGPVKIEIIELGMDRR
jgi:rare lipoprotein A